MPRRYKGVVRNARSFRRVSVPFPHGDPPPNDPYWQDKLSILLERIESNESWTQIWESPIVPDRATYKEHARLAQAIIDGKLTTRGWMG